MNIILPTDTQILENLRIESSSVNPKQCSMPFPNIWWNELPHGATFVLDSVQMTLVCWTVYIYQPLLVDKTWHKVNFSVEFNSFKVRLFLLLYWLPNQGKRTNFALPFTQSSMENKWIHTFLKGISARGNAINLVQDLNSCRSFHFLRR